MPVRLPTICAFRAAAPKPVIGRSFTTSALLASPPREPPHPNHRNTPTTTSSSSSSSSSLLSIDERGSNNASTASGPAAPQAKGAVASRMMSRFKDRANSALREKQSQLDFLRNRKISDDYLKQMPRRWAAGDVYSPHDMSSVEMQKWRRRSGRRGDVVDALGIRPLDMYKNFSLVQEFTSSSGQINHSSSTGLRPVNQRKIAKMIRRIQGMGIYPTIHDHPELIRNDFFPEKGRK